MTISHRSTLTALALMATLATPVAANAEGRAACDVLPASTASQILGRAVTAKTPPYHGAPGPGGVASVCMYSAGEPVFQLGVTTMASPAAAEQVAKAVSSVRRPNVEYRVAGNHVVSAIDMTHSMSKKLAALVDAAVKNL